ncbi:MAG: hypothetical protein F2934_01960 [Actinobacteria bacterium]|uniref:Unannotated protein n=1 Tax=freshwater metagenome TaxID=449393 RepID=A0A6J6TPD2_9ZZZZ|nr:hypothetical protein [Actinomycetota bacterium]MSZ03651.1 hypothetical protein [Actinomycetota bacterium]MTB05877.1 hypothetical protein [Actinomycetota bacterium]
MSRNSVSSPARLTAALALTGLVGVGALTACSGNSSDAKSANKTVVLDLVSGVPKTVKSDLGEPGPSIGDLATFNAGVTKDGKAFGTLVGTKILVVLPGDDGVGTFQNQLTFVLPDGTITVTGVQPYPVDPNNAAAVAKVRQGTTQRSIVGGTGAYAGARGVLTTSEEKDGARTQHFEYTVESGTAKA